MVDGGRLDGRSLVAEVHSSYLGCRVAVFHLVFYLISSCLIGLEHCTSCVFSFITTYPSLVSASWVFGSVRLASQSAPFFSFETDTLMKSS
jgi:hypothetical protein